MKSSEQENISETWLVISGLLIVAFIIGSMFWAIWYVNHQQRVCDALYGDEWDSYGTELCVETDMGVKK